MRYYQILEQTEYWVRFTTQWCERIEDLDVTKPSITLKEFKRRGWEHSACASCSSETREGIYAFRMDAITNILKRTAALVKSSGTSQRIPEEIAELFVGSARFDGNRDFCQINVITDFVGKEFGRRKDRIVLKSAKSKAASNAPRKVGLTMLREFLHAWATSLPGHIYLYGGYSGDVSSSESGEKAIRWYKEQITRKQLEKYLKQKGTDPRRAVTILALYDDPKRIHEAK